MIKRSSDDCSQELVYKGHIKSKEDINHHNQSLSIAKQLGDKTGEGHAYSNLGNAYP